VGKVVEAKGENVLEVKADACQNPVVDVQAVEEEVGVEEDVAREQTAK
jgi:hypothetical protein